MVDESSIVALFNEYKIGCSLIFHQKWKTKCSCTIDDCVSMIYDLKCQIFMGTHKGLMNMIMFFSLCKSCLQT
jgi:hypothetical protein